MSETFDRSQLDGKDREQLGEIASALGVKGTSRMRKADLVDAIVGATSAPVATNGADRAAPRKVRSTRGADDDFASIAEEENSLAGGSQPADEMALIRPRRRSITAEAGNGSGSEAPSNGVATETSHGTSQARTDGGRDDSGRDAPGDRAGADTDTDTGTDNDRHNDRVRGPTTRPNRGKRERSA